MATSKAKKTDQLSKLEKKFEQAKGIAFIRFIGPTVDDVQKVRRELREKGMSYTVIKKTLIALASKNIQKVEFSSRDLEGNVAAIVSANDEIEPASAIKKIKKDFFNKQTKTSKFDFAGAIFEGKFLDKEKTQVLANTPTKEESFAKIIATLRNGPQKIHATLLHGLKGITMACKEADKFCKN